MGDRLAGSTVTDARGRSSPNSSPTKSSTTPLRKSASTPLPSPSARRTSTPISQSPLRQQLQDTSSIGADDDRVDDTADPSPTHRLSPDELLQLPGTIRHLHPRLVAPFITKTTELAEAYNKEPSELNLYNILAFIKVGVNPALRNGISATIDRIAAYPNVIAPEPSPHQPPQPDRVKKAKLLVESGLVGKAERALNDAAGVAPLTDDVLRALAAKHPAGSPNPCGQPIPANNPHAEMPDDEVIKRAVRSFPSDTAPGPSGWTPKLLSLASSSPSFLEFLTTLTAQVAAGLAPGRNMLCAARLTPLLKPDGGIRPIAVGELFYRLAMKAIFRSNNQKSFLSPHQFGVGTKGGTEPAIQAIRRTIQRHPSFPYRFLFSLDFKNAFNALSRPALFAALRRYAPSLLRLAQWSLNTPSSLLVKAEDGTFEMESAEGVRQGDPMGPLFFSIGIRAVVEELQALLGPRFLVIAYLDDIFILSPDDSVKDITLKFFADPSRPISLNSSKCRLYDLHDIDNNPVFMLGTCLGSRAAREQFLDAAVNQLEQDLESIHLLPRQHALLLLRQSIQTKLRHLLRTLKSDDLVHLWQKADDLITSAFDKIRGSAPLDCQRDRALIALPTSLGGLGLFSHVGTAPIAFASASALSDDALSNLIATPLPACEIRSQRDQCREASIAIQTNLMATLDTREQITLAESASLLGRKWLDALPTSKRLLLSDSVVQAGLHYRTFMAGHTGACRKCALPNFAGHDEACLARPSYTVSRHEAIKHSIASGLRTIKGLDVLAEPFMANLRRRNDLRVSSIDGPVAKEEYDVKVITLYAPTHSRSFAAASIPASDPPTPLQDAFARVQQVLAYQGKRKTNRLPVTNDPAPMVPLVFSSGGILESATLTKLKQFKSWGLSHPIYSWLLTSLSVSLVKARGRTFDS